ncbi:hypothetical protein NQ314_018953 [Rhamnusium bicolor]|uniref:DDE Tnp4 domain-containing protein n=1 Tax=Rhamnusium bicolor TaxID=1586634 RepID=A0AAV8WPT8_9CUCU|nr:hypothetical protein NQ314_018953 [Rhamnusium bicolor]
MHDVRVFRNSPGYQRLTGNPPLLPPNQHLIGDAAYPLMVNLIKPYRDNGHLNDRQRCLNQRLSSQRAAIEMAFGLLKGKWRRLKYLDMLLDEKDDNEMGPDENDKQVENDDAVNDIDERNSGGALKRDYLATLI